MSDKATDIPEAFRGTSRLDVHQKGPDLEGHFISEVDLTPGENPFEGYEPGINSDFEARLDGVNDKASRVLTEWLWREEQRNRAVTRAELIKALQEAESE